MYSWFPILWFCFDDMPSITISSVFLTFILQVLQNNLNYEMGLFS